MRPRVAPSAVPGRLEAGGEGEARRGQDDGPDDVRGPGRPRVLERPFAQPWLDELEVGEAREAPAAAERQPDDELQREHGEQPPRADGDRDEREDPDRRLVEARRAGVDHRRVDVWIGRALHRPSVATGRPATPRKLESPASGSYRLDGAGGRPARGHRRGVRAHPGTETAEEPDLRHARAARVLARLRLPEADGADRLQAAQGRPARHLDRRRRRGRADDRAGEALSEGAGRDRAGTAATTPAGSCRRATTGRGSTCAASTRRSRCRTRSGST